jgi:hypothetical protein
VPTNEPRKVSTVRFRVMGFDTTAGVPPGAVEGEKLDEMPVEAVVYAVVREPVTGAAAIDASRG